MNRQAAVGPLTRILTTMYATLAVLEVAMLVLFPTRTPASFAPLALLHGATAGASWRWGTSDGGIP